MPETLLNGTSNAADYVLDRVRKCARLLQKSAAFGFETLIRGELADVWKECSEPDWDGHDGLPVTWDVYVNAERFLRSLPLGTPAPSIGAEPDGQITFEWARGRRRRLSVSISPDGDLHYAALLGPGKTCGTEPFFDDTPEVIQTLIAEVS